MRNRIPIFGFALAALAACGSVEKAKPSPAIPAEAEVILGDGLSAQSLAAGECGLFLWTYSVPRTLIFFAKAESETATLMQSGSEKSVRLSGVSGAIFGQFMTEQAYTLPDGGAVRIAFAPGEELEGGQRTRDGRLVSVTSDGWETITPVIGVRACQPGG